MAENDINEEIEETDVIDDFLEFAASLLGVDTDEAIIDQLGSSTRNVQYVQLAIRFKTAVAFENLAEAVWALVEKEDSDDEEEEGETPELTPLPEFQAKPAEEEKEEEAASEKSEEEESND